MEQELWAVDLDIGMSDMQGMCGLLGQVTGGEYSWEKGVFALPGQTEGTGVEEVCTVHLYSVCVRVCVYTFVCATACTACACTCV